MSLRIIAPSPHGFRVADAYGAGHFGASRTRYTPGVMHVAQRYEHKGTDWIVVPGEHVLCPCRVLVTFTGRAYMQDDRYDSIHMQSVEFPQHELKLLYARLDLPGTLPIEVAAGVPFAVAQDLRARYPGISPHVHLEIRLRGTLVDPVSLLAEAA